jgi:hypothetical protein
MMLNLEKYKLTPCWKRWNVRSPGNSREENDGHTKPFEHFGDNEDLPCSVTHTRHIFSLGVNTPIQCAHHTTTAAAAACPATPPPPLLVTFHRMCLMCVSAVAPLRGISKNVNPISVLFR